MKVNVCYTFKLQIFDVAPKKSCKVKIFRYILIYTQVSKKISLFITLRLQTLILVDCNFPTPLIKTIGCNQHLYIFSIIAHKHSLFTYAQ